MDNGIDFQDQLPSGGCSVCGKFGIDDDYTLEERRAGLHKFVWFSKSHGVRNDGEWLCEDCAFDQLTDAEKRPW